jgi:putative salt-induced outer membrane protein YdiY
MRGFAISRMMLTVMVAVSGVSASADQIVMKNGDRLTGKLITKENGTLKFETPYAGVIDIKWDTVESVVLDEPVRVMLENEDVRKASAIERDGGKVRLRLDPDMESDLAVEELEEQEVAVVKPEPWRLGEAWKFSGRANFGFEYERGNTDTDEFDFDGEITIERAKTRFHAFGTVERDVSNDNEKDRTTKQKWSLFGKADQFVTKKRYWDWGVFAQADDKAELTLRAATGPAAGYQFFQSEKMNLSVDAGPARVWEKYQSEEDEQYWALRWGVNFDRQLFDNLAQVFHRQIGLAGLTEHDKAYILSRTGVRFPIYAGFTATAQAELEWDNDPPGNVDKLDSTYTFLLGYEW